MYFINRLLFLCPSNDLDCVFVKSARYTLRQGFQHVVVRNQKSEIDY